MRRGPVQTWFAWLQQVCDLPGVELNLAPRDDMHAALRLRHSCHGNESCLWDPGAASSFPCFAYFASVLVSGRPFAGELDAQPKSSGKAASLSSHAFQLAGVPTALGLNWGTHSLSGRFSKMCALDAVASSCGV